MCIIKNVKDSLTVGGFNMAPVHPSSSSDTSSSSGSLIQIMKPKLPRRVTRTPRINLNKYWNILEDIMTENESNSNRTGSTENKLFEDQDMNNEINDNISNEQKENEYILMRNNDANVNNINMNTNARRPARDCSCNLCLISNLRNITVSDNCEEGTEL